METRAHIINILTGMNSALAERGEFSPITNEEIQKAPDLFTLKHFQVVLSRAL